MKDPSWVRGLAFLPYTSVGDGKDVEWAGRRAMLEMMLADARKLLQLPHHQFWSQVVFDESLQRFLDSYVFFAPRQYDKSPYLTAPPEVAAQEEDLQSAVFRILFRMSMVKESERDFMEPRTFGAVLYENWLFDIPKLMDICGIFGRQNEKLTREMVTRIFEAQPKYFHDLSDALKTIIDSMNRSSVDHGGQSILSEVTAMANQPPPAAMMHVAPHIFRDLQLFVVDSTAALTNLLRVYPSTGKVCI